LTGRARKIDFSEHFVDCKHWGLSDARLVVHPKFSHDFLHRISLMLPGWLFQSTTFSKHDEYGLDPRKCSKVLILTIISKDERTTLCRDIAFKLIDEGLANDRAWV